MKKLTVVIPCLNEEKTLEICIKKCFKAFEELNIEGSVLVSDNGSVDSSRDIAIKNGAEVTICDQKGYGNALRHGFSVAQSEYVLMADADDTYDFLEIPLLFNK